MRTSLSAASAHVRRLAARAPVALDVLIVIGIVVVGSLHGPDGPHQRWAWAWSVALAFPLLARRRYPAQVFALISMIALAQWTAGPRAFGDAALLVALYTVAAQRPARVAAAAFVVIEIGVVIALAKWTGGDNAINGFVGLTALATAATAMGINGRNRRALLTSLEDRATRLELERDQQGQLAAAAERSRIAREMHDIVAHNLSVMIALADGASYAIHDEPARAERAMQTASSTGRQALTEMRRLLGVLRDDAPAEERAPQPGLGQLDALVEQVRGAGMPVTLTAHGAPMGGVPAGLELAAYRIIQEALTNSLKHAGPGAAGTVSLVWHADRLAIQVRDTGLVAGATAATDGGGLRGMHERAAVYDGAVEAGPAPGGGWVVRTELRCAATLDGGEIGGREAGAAARSSADEARGAETPA